MNEPNPPKPHKSGDLPPDLPPEYADAYRRGYQRAWASGHGELEPIAEPEPLASYEDLFVDSTPPEPLWEGSSRSEAIGDHAKPGWLVPALLGSLILVLVFAAYVLGRLFSSSVDSPPAGNESLVMPRDTPGAVRSTAQGKPWKGDVIPLSGLGASSGCVLSPGNDASGRKVRYTPEQAVDGDFTTAWRCAGDGRGTTLRITLESTAEVAQVGLVPGYAKTDPQSGADRYAENNRITRVRWTFSDGSSVIQRLDGSPTLRRLQTLRIPPVETDSVTLQVLTSVKGARNTIAISEVELSEAVG